MEGSPEDDLEPIDLEISPVERAFIDALVATNRLVSGQKASEPTPGAEVVCPVPGMVEIVRLCGDANQEFAAMILLREWCDSGEWALGEMQRGAPMGLKMTPGEIPRWRDLSQAARDGLDGVVCWLGSPRHGTAVVFLRETLLDPPEVP